jgi:hypothetical protein
LPNFYDIGGAVKKAADSKAKAPHRCNDEEPQERINTEQQPYANKGA